MYTTSATTSLITSSTQATLQWVDSLNLALGSTHLNGETLLEALSLHPHLKKQVEKNWNSAELLIENCQKNLCYLIDKIPSTISWNEFLLLTILYHISKKSTPPPACTKIAACEAELETARKLVREIFSSLGIPSPKIALFSALLSTDCQNLFLEEEIALHELVDNVHEMAASCQQDPLSFYQFLSAFHLAEGGHLSYQENHLQKIIKVESYLQGSRSGTDSYVHLMTLIVHNEPVDKVKTFFYAHLLDLHCFLEKTNREMCRLTGNCPPDKQFEFRHIKRGFRDIFLYMITDKRYLERYSDIIDMKKGSDPYEIVWQWANFQPEVKNYKNHYDLCRLLDELAHFRENYLLRFSLHKIEAFVKKMIASPCQHSHSFTEENLSKLKKLDDQNKLFLPEVLSRLPITFIHATNSSVLPSLAQSAYTLFPVGRLFKMNMVPYSGVLSYNASV